MWPCAYLHICHHTWSKSTLKNWGPVWFVLGLSYFHYISLHFHNSSLIFRGTHTSCNCLVWFLFSISITHDWKNWVRVMENENKFLVFLDFKAELRWQFHNFAHLLGSHMYVLSTLKSEFHMHYNSSITVHTLNLCYSFTSFLSFPSKYNLSKLERKLEWKVKKVFGQNYPYL